MPQSKTKSKKGASGMGNIRKITKTTKGKEYTYYEARYTAGYDPGTGKQIQRSITGKTQKEVAQKLKEVLGHSAQRPQDATPPFVKLPWLGEMLH